MLRFREGSGSSVGMPVAEVVVDQVEVDIRRKSERGSCRRVWKSNRYLLLRYEQSSFRKLESPRKPSLFDTPLVDNRSLRNSEGCSSKRFFKIRLNSGVNHELFLIGVAETAIFFIPGDFLIVFPGYEPRPKPEELAVLPSDESEGEATQEHPRYGNSASSCFRRRRTSKDATPVYTPLNVFFSVATLRTE